MTQDESIYVPGSVPRWFIYPSHPGTNRVRRRVTTLLETNALPLSQACKRGGGNCPGRTARRSLLSDSDFCFDGIPFISWLTPQTIKAKIQEIEISSPTKNRKLIEKQVADFKLSKIYHLMNTHLKRLLNSLWPTLYFRPLFNPLMGTDNYSATSNSKKLVYTGRWWIGCYIWYSNERTGRSRSPPRPLLAVPNVTAHLSTASVPITVLLYNGPLLFGFNVAIKGLITRMKTTQNDDTDRQRRNQCADVQVT